MTSVPIEPYWRSQPSVGSKRFEREDRRNKIALNIARHANQMILECPDDTQILTFNEIARRSGYSVDQVKDALSHGEGNGLTVAVCAEGRELIRRKLACG